MKNFIENHTLEELNKVPEGFNNNVIWNIAHTIVTQQLLVYKLSGLPTMVSEEMIETYKKGTKTEGDLSQADVDTIKDLLYSTIEKTKEDYANGKFVSYNEYTTGTGFHLASAMEAMNFNNYHEALHMGFMMNIRKI